MAGTLVFPCGWVATEYAMSLTPGATWGSVAYTQYGNLPLLQVISVTGLWGLTFMIAWFAAVGCAVWELRGRGGAVRVAAVLFTTTLTAVVLCGEARLALAPPRGATVRVASFARPLIGSDTTRVALSHLNAHSETAADLREIVRREHAQAESLLARAAVEAHAGAKIVFWAEGNARVLKEDESALLARGQEVARANHVYLGMALSAWDRARRPPRENKIALVDPAGGIAWQYLKTFPVPGAEARTIAGDGRLRMLDTPLGRLTAAICYDADFPRLLGQAGALHADILLDPADDWEAIDPLHTRMASFRAIEQGVNLIRQTANGRSAAYDYEGHVLGEEDYFGAPDHTMIAQVPVHGARTIYTRIGDVVAWLCVATLAWLAVRATVARPRVTV